MALIATRRLVARKPWSQSVRPNWPTGPWVMRADGRWVVWVEVWRKKFQVASLLSEIRGWERGGCFGLSWRLKSERMGCKGLQWNTRLTLESWTSYVRWLLAVASRKASWGSCSWVSWLEKGMRRRGWHQAPVKSCYWRALLLCPLVVIFYCWWSWILRPFFQFSLSLPSIANNFLFFCTI